MEHAHAFEPIRMAGSPSRGSAAALVWRQGHGEYNPRDCRSTGLVDLHQSGTFCEIHRRRCGLTRLRADNGPAIFRDFPDFWFLCIFVHRRPGRMLVCYPHFRFDEPALCRAFDM